MTTIALDLPRRRGACPGLSAPMPSGDGLLARLRPIGTIALDAFAGLCAAARRHGNGVIEITSRGSLQIRGLSHASAPLFAADVAALGIAASDGVPVHCNALAGIGANEIIDAETLAAALRRALAQQSIAARLSPKISVAVDGGGPPGLAIAADIRLCAQKTNGDVMLRVAVGGDGKSAADLGTVAMADGVEAAVRLLEVIARSGRASRARDVAAAEGISRFQSAIVDLLASGCPRDSRLRGNERDVIGMHCMRDGSFACAVGPAFGHSDAATLERLVEAANGAGARGFRAAPGRALLATGLPQPKTSGFAATAERLGFITRSDDRRRLVFACAGAPVCASAHIAARALAPMVAAQATGSVHISGCPKGCAHAAPAALTIVGTAESIALVANGTAREAPFAIVTADELAGAIATFTRAAMREAGRV